MRHTSFAGAYWYPLVIAHVSQGHHMLLVRTVRGHVPACYLSMQINRGDISEEELAVRREKAMADPNIQNILTDPVMRQVIHPPPLPD